MELDKTKPIRRNFSDRCSLVENKIQECVEMIDKMGADPRLTDAINHLLSGRRQVSDFIDQEKTKTDKEINAYNAKCISIAFVRFLQNSEIDPKEPLSASYDRFILPVSGTFCATGDSK